MASANVQADDIEFTTAPATVASVGRLCNMCLVRRLSDETPIEYQLFVSRYPQSSDLCSWLRIIPNQHVHFGDFDLAGIHIFLSEFYPHIGNRSSFLIPQDIEEQLRHGSMERYNAQYQKFKKLTTEIPNLQQLIDTIHKYHRCYDQEGYIRFNHGL